MNGGPDFDSEQLPVDLQALATAIDALAQKGKGDSLALLALLRTLQTLHAEIRDGIFQECLPDNRQALYALLKDIEAQGGWPHIPRLPLQSLLVHLCATCADEEPLSSGPTEAEV